VDVSLLVFLILVILVVALAVLLNRRWPISRVRSHPRYSYIPPITLNHSSGWIKTKHPSRWVRARLLNAGRRQLLLPLNMNQCKEYITIPIAGVDILNT